MDRPRRDLRRGQMAPPPVHRPSPEGHGTHRRAHLVVHRQLDARHEARPGRGERGVTGQRSLLHSRRHCILNHFTSAFAYSSSSSFSVSALFSATFSLSFTSTFSFSSSSASLLSFLSWSYPRSGPCPHCRSPRSRSRVPLTSLFSTTSTPTPHRPTNPRPGPQGARRPPPLLLRRVRRRHAVLHPGPARRQGRGGPWDAVCPIQLVSGAGYGWCTRGARVVHEGCAVTVRALYEHSCTSRARVRVLHHRAPVTRIRARRVLHHRARVTRTVRVRACVCVLVSYSYSALGRQGR